jgi:aerobic carbon-monoxide dehydrogenase medium subunit
MKPSRFDYAVPRSVSEVLDLLARDPDETSLLAGGQSLVPMLNMRMARPRLLVDLNRVEGLDGLEEAADGRIRIGAMTRQRRLETEPLVRERLPLLTEAARHIAHVAIRTRGTVGGSLAHADPSAELPATISVLEGVLVVRGAGGERSIPASEFFVGPLTSAIEPGELLVGVELEPPPDGAGWAFLEVARTHGAFALAAVAAVMHLDADGRIALARIALNGVGRAPYVPAWLEEIAVGEAPDEALFGRIGERVRDEVEPFDDVHAPADYRKRVAGALSTRALHAAVARAGGDRAA